MSERGFEDDELNKPKLPKNTKTPYLESYGKDLTLLARQGKLDPVIGREHEIEQVIQILNKKKSNNPILCGESGVGKTAIVEGLALKAISKDADRWLFNKRIIELNMMSVVAGTKYRGEFEQRMEEIMKEIKANPDVIVFIDEIHNILGAGGASGSMDAANIIKPSLSRGEMHCIGATTLDEYKSSIENDSALDRRFQKVLISTPSKEQTKEILAQAKIYYEEFHNVIYSDDVVDKIIELSDRYISYKNFPAKGVDLLDQVGSMVKLKDFRVSELIKTLEIELRDYNEKKIEAAATQRYEDANMHKHKMIELVEKIEKENAKWQEELKSQKYL